MRKLLYILLFSVVGHTSVYASFPVSGYNNFTQIETIDEDTEDDKKLTKRQKFAWFFAGFIGFYFGVIIALIAQLISRKKKGQFKFALFGFLSMILIALCNDFSASIVEDRPRYSLF